MDAFEYSESDVLYTQLSLCQKFVNNPHQIVRFGGGLREIVSPD